MSVIQGSLRKLKTECTIVTHPDAKAFAIMYPRWVPIPLLPAIGQKLEQMKDLEVIQRVDRTTQWCTPMVVARKSLHIYVEYAELNNQIIYDWVIMPTVEENLSKLVGAQVFSQLDVNSVYWQVPLAATSCHLIMFIISVGRLMFKRSPFGIATTPEFFHREMHRILEGTLSQVCHMNDVLVFRKDKTEHDKHLREVLCRLQRAG